MDTLYIMWCTAEVDALARWGGGLVLALGLAVRRSIRWDRAREVVMLVVTRVLVLQLAASVAFYVVSCCGCCVLSLCACRGLWVFFGFLIPFADRPSFLSPFEHSLEHRHHYRH